MASPSSVEALGRQCVTWRRPSQQRSSSKSECQHSILCGNVCKECGKRIDSSNTQLIALGYVHQGLKLTLPEMDRLRGCEQANLLGNRKLCLVLDLDQTLLHSIPKVALSAGEKYLCGNNKTKDSLNLFQWKFEGSGMVTKLRPYVHTFLEEASLLFDLYVYTMGNRPYALAMRKFLDPHNKFFSDFKIISKEDCTQKDRKCLDVIPVSKSIVIVLDDNKHNVWGNNNDNLIIIQPYYYFAEHGPNVTSFAESHKDESESSGPLAMALQQLKRVHHLFFTEGNPTGNDVRHTLHQ